MSSYRRFYHLPVTHPEGKTNPAPLIHCNFQFELSLCPAFPVAKIGVEWCGATSHLEQRISEGCTSASWERGEKCDLPHRSPSPLLLIHLSPDLAPLTCTWLSGLIARRHHPCNHLVRQVTTSGPLSAPRCPWLTCRLPSRTPGSSRSPSGQTG